MTKFTEVEPIDETHFRAIQVPRSFKRLTAGRFAKVLACNQWGTPFQAWCEIMRCRIPPFEDTKYTIAGKKIEPKLIEYAKEYVSPYILDPEEYFECDDAKRFMSYEFFADELFGGMWDALAFDVPNAIESAGVKPIAVIECKTSSRPQDWENGVPENYKAQGLLYAELLDVEDVYFPVAFLEPDDYDDPDSFVCTDENTRLFHVGRNEKVAGFDNIVEAMDYATRWWESYVLDNHSPSFDERRDADYLACLRQCDLTDIEVEGDLDKLLWQLNQIDCEIEQRRENEGIPVLEAKRKEVNKKVQELVKPVLNATEGKDTLDTDHYMFKVSPSKKVDYEKLEQDGVFDKYVSYIPKITTKRK